MTKSKALAEIEARAAEVFGSTEAGRRWLHTPAVALEQRRPMDLLTTQDGLQVVKTLLTQLEYNVYI